MRNTIFYQNGDFVLLYACVCDLYRFSSSVYRFINHYVDLHFFSLEVKWCKEKEKG